MKYRSFILIILLLMSGCAVDNASSRDYKELADTVNEQNDKIDNLENELKFTKTDTDVLLTKYAHIVELLADIQIRQDALESQISRRTIDEELVNSLSADIEFLNNIVRNLTEYSSSNDGYLRIREADNMIFEYDEVEWIDVNDEDRIEAIGLDIENDFPNGFYLFNETEKYEVLESNLDVKYHLLDEAYMHIDVTYEEFIEEVQQHEPGLFCGLVFVDGRLIAIYEAYLI